MTPADALRCWVVLLCHREAHEEFNATDFAHTADCPAGAIPGGGVVEDSFCAWSGKGAEVSCSEDDGFLCPRCEMAVEPIDTHAPAGGEG